MNCPSKGKKELASSGENRFHQNPKIPLTLLSPGLCHCHNHYPGQGQFCLWKSTFYKKNHFTEMKLMKNKIIVLPGTIASSATLTSVLGVPSPLRLKTSGKTRRIQETLMALPAKDLVKTVKEAHLSLVLRATLVEVGSCLLPVWMKLFWGRRRRRRNWN